jgi:hypothetical protein
MKSEPSEPKKDEHGDGDESLTTAKESYVRLIIGDPRKLQHRSLFNSIQQAACEQIMRTEDISKMNPDVNEVLVPLWYRNGSRCLELVEDVGGAGIIKGLQHLFLQLLSFCQDV